MKRWLLHGESCQRVVWAGSLLLNVASQLREGQKDVAFTVW